MFTALFQGNPDCVECLSRCPWNRTYLAASQLPDGDRLRPWSRQRMLSQFPLRPPFHLLAGSLLLLKPIGFIWSELSDFEALWDDSRTNLHTCACHVIIRNAASEASVICHLYEIANCYKSICPCWTQSAASKAWNLCCQIAGVPALSLADTGLTEGIDKPSVDKDKMYHISKGWKARYSSPSWSKVASVGKGKYAAINARIRTKGWVQSLGHVCAIRYCSWQWM